MWANSALFQHKHQTVAGLPMPTAIFYVLLFAVAFWVYTTLWRQAPVMTSDSGGYLAVASDLTDFRIDHLRYRTPGYPLLLLITASGEVPSRTLFFFSLLLHFISIWILASVLYAIGLTETMLSLFGLLLLLPPYVESAAYVMSENLTEFMLVVGFGSFVLWSLRCKTLWLFISALAIGYASLTRPTYQALAFAMTGSLFVMPALLGWSPAIRKNVIKASVILICASVMLVGGYILLNYIKFDYFGLSPIMPIALSSRTARVIEQLPDEYATVREVLIRERDALLVARGSEHTGSGYLSNPDFRRELTEITGLQTPQLEKYLLHLNLLLIRKAPINYLYDVACAFSKFWFPSSTMLANMNSRFMQLLWGVIHFCLIGIFALTLVVFVGGLPYMLTYKRFLVRSDKTLLREHTSSQMQGCVYILAGTIVIYTALISSFSETGDPRYRVPTDGLIALMAFLGIDLYRRSVRCAKMVFEKRQSEGETD
jgi:hypothetical protein